MLFFAMKWWPTCYKMVPDKLENGTYCCFSKLDCRLFISKSFAKAVCILLVSFTISHFHKSSQTLLHVFQPLGWRCVECAIHHEQDVQEEQHPYICGANPQWQSEHSVWSLLLVLPQCEALHTRDDQYLLYRLDIRQDSEFTTGYVGLYPKTAFKREPVSSEISDFCVISELLLFLIYFACQSERIKFDNYFFVVCCAN